ncbi:reverse transcriptase domain-containing protein [Tanacetum coccineum]
MNGINNPELIRRLNDRVPQTFDELMKRTRSFIQGEAAAADSRKGYSHNRSQEQTRRQSNDQSSSRNHSYRSQRGGRGNDKYTPLIMTPKEILATEGANFPKPPPMRTPEEQCVGNGYCEYHRQKGHTTNEKRIFKKKSKKKAKSKQFQAREGKDQVKSKSKVIRMKILQLEGLKLPSLKLLASAAICKNGGVTEAIRLFLAYASFIGFMVYQMDVKSAFLYGKIEEEVYVTQPKGFMDPKHPKKVYKVVKALYGLHQAPKAWKFDLESKKTATTSYEPQKPKDKNGPDDDVNVHLYRSMMCDYAGNNNDRKSTTSVCQFLGRRYAISHDPFIYDSLVKKFWRTASLRLAELGIQTANTTQYPAHKMTKKVFANMKMRFVGAHMPFLPAMLAGAVEDQGERPAKPADQPPIPALLPSPVNVPNPPIIAPTTTSPPRKGTNIPPSDHDQPSSSRLDSSDSIYIK